jgi:hypothetical protein
MPARRAKAAIGRPPSPIRWLPGVTIPASAAPMEARRPEAGRRRRSPPSGRGRRGQEYCPDRLPDACPCRPVYVARARQVGPPAFEGFEDEGFVRFDDPAQASRLVGGRRAQKPMPPAEGRRRMNAAQLRGLSQALALDHRARVSRPFLLLAQMRHRRFGQRIERAPATLAAEPQQPVRAAPADDLSASAMGATLAFHSLNARRSKRVLPTPPLAPPLP